MGYRSDVAYTIRFTDEESYRLFIMEAKVKDLGGCFSDGAECDDERLRIDFSVNGLKWYDSFPEVMMHNALVALAGDWATSDSHRQIRDGVEGEAEVSHRIGYVFVRVGEDDDDNETLYGGTYEYHWLSIRREIVTG